MTDSQLQKELTEMIADKSLNACICFERMESGEIIDYRPIYVNEAFSRMFSLQLEEVSETTVRKLPDERGQEVFKLAEKTMDMDTSVTEIYYDQERDSYYKTTSLKLMEHYMCLIILDVTGFEKSRLQINKLYQEMSASEEELRYQVDLLNATQNRLIESERIYKLVSDYANDGFLYCNYAGQNFLASQRWYNIFPIEQAQLSDKNLIYSFIVEEDRTRYIAERSEAVRHHRSEQEFQYQIKDNGGWIRQTTWYEYDGQGRLKEEVAFYQDITREKLQRDELEHLAYYDSFTGICNRNYFTRWMGERIEAARNKPVIVQMIYLDIDHFKWVNDRLGIQLADELLLRFVSVIRQFESDEVMVGRFSNDEFVIGLGDARDNNAARMLGEIVMDKLKSPIYLSNGMKYYITVSIGIAECDQEIQTAQELIRAADLAMLEAKKAGRNIMVRYDKSMADGFLYSVILEQRLNAAVEGEKFYLVYQPQYDVKAGRMRGVEALIRWEDEELGAVSPVEFIPIAEQNGMIHQIGDWVMREAFRTLRQWQKDFAYEGIMSINISAVQFKNSQFLDKLKQYTDWNELKPETIEIELTESVLIDEFEETILLMKRIRDMGYRISLDDFGTGYSSLSYLKRVPLDVLKIDRSFITTLFSDTGTAVITSCVIEMAEKLGFEIIAEGVEEKEQLDYLRENHCVLIQGYLLGRPMPEADIQLLFHP